MRTCPKCESRMIQVGPNNPASENLVCIQCGYGSGVGSWDPLDQFKSPDQQQKLCGVCQAAPALPDDGTPGGGLCEGCRRHVKAQAPKFKFGLLGPKMVWETNPPAQREPPDQQVLMCATCKVRAAARPEDGTASGGVCDGCRRMGITLRWAVPIVVLLIVAVIWWT